MSHLNYWKDPSFPKWGWRFTSSYDLGKGNTQLCVMCGLKEIRYVHTVAHTCGFELEVGCVCCDNLTGNAAERAEREKKLRQARRAAEQEAYRALCGDRFDRLAQAELALRQRKDLQANMRKVRQWQGKPSKYLHSIWNGLDLHLIRVTRDKMRRPIPPVWGFTVNGTWSPARWKVRDDALRELSEAVYPLDEIENTIETLKNEIAAIVDQNPDVPAAIGRITIENIAPEIQTKI